MTEEQKAKALVALRTILSNINVDDVIEEAADTIEAALAPAEVTNGTIAKGEDVSIIAGKTYVNGAEVTQTAEPVAQGCKLIPLEINAHGMDWKFIGAQYGTPNDIRLSMIDMAVEAAPEADKAASVAKNATVQADALLAALKRIAEHDYKATDIGIKYGVSGSIAIRAIQQHEAGHD